MTNSPVWLQNLRGFIKGQFPASEEWKQIFLRELDALGSWQSMDSAPRDGTHILAVLHREACEDMDGVRRGAFSEVREIWYRPYRQFGMELPWHAGDPFDSHEGMAPDHMGDAIPIAWKPMPSLPKPGRV